MTLRRITPGPPRLCEFFEQVHGLLNIANWIFYEHLYQGFVATDLEKHRIEVAFFFCPICSYSMSSAAVSSGSVHLACPVDEIPVDGACRRADLFSREASQYDLNVVPV